MQPEDPQPVSAQPQLPPAPQPSGEGKKKLGVLGTIGALLFKFKTLGLVILTKGKLVLLGLT